MLAKNLHLLLENYVFVYHPILVGNNIQSEVVVQRFCLMCEKCLTYVMFQHHCCTDNDNTIECFLNNIQVLTLNLTQAATTTKCCKTLTVCRVVTHVLHSNRFNQILCISECKICLNICNLILIITHNLIHICCKFRH